MTHDVRLSLFGLTGVPVYLRFKTEGTAGGPDIGVWSEGRSTIRQFGL